MCARPTWESEHALFELSDGEIVDGLMDVSGNVSPLLGEISVNKALAVAAEEAYLLRIGLFRSHFALLCTLDHPALQLDRLSSRLPLVLENSQVHSLCPEPGRKRTHAIFLRFSIPSRVLF
jgi:hypothetical protein